MPIQFQRWTNETEYLELAADLDIGQTSMTVTDGSKLYQIAGRDWPAGAIVQCRSTLQPSIRRPTNLLWNR